MDNASFANSMPLSYSPFFVSDFDSKINLFALSCASEKTAYSSILAFLVLIE